MIGMAHIGDLRLRDLGFGRSRVEQKLVHLVRANVAENSAVLFRIPEPVRPARAAARDTAALKDLVRRNVDGLDDLADGALLDEHAGVDGGLHLEPLAVHDAVDAFRLGDGLAHFGQLFERCDAGLV